MRQKEELFFYNFRYTPLCFVRNMMQKFIDFFIVQNLYSALSCDSGRWETVMHQQRTFPDETER